MPSQLRSPRVSLIAKQVCLILPVLILGSHTAAAQGSGSTAPSGWDAKIRLVEAVDLNPDGDVVEVKLVARVAEVEIEPGKSVKAWTYDGGYPGR
jgi:hypothetical protein